MPTYIFLDKQEYDGLKGAVAKLQSEADKKPEKKDAPSGPVWAAFLILIFAFILVAWQRKNPSLCLIILVAANSMAQMALDFFKGDAKPIFSALARALPILIGVANYYWP